MVKTVCSMWGEECGPMMMVGKVMYEAIQQPQGIPYYCGCGGNMRGRWQLEPLTSDSNGLGGKVNKK
jgi:hypothetical protein